MIKFKNTDPFGGLFQFNRTNIFIDAEMQINIKKYWLKESENKIKNMNSLNSLSRIDKRTFNNNSLIEEDKIVKYNKEIIKYENVMINEYENIYNNIRMFIKYVNDSILLSGDYKYAYDMNYKLHNIIFIFV